MIEKEKDITLNEMVLRLAAERVVSIGRSALDVWLRKRGWTFKKRPRMHWSRVSGMPMAPISFRQSRIVAVWGGELPSISTGQSV